jgi:hypothetical protein
VKPNLQTKREANGPYSFRLIEGVPPMTLPILATASDVREVVQFLKRRPEGVTIVDTMDAARKRIFDPRKVFAYELWGLVSREGDRLRLSPLGWELAERLTPEAEIYRAILNRTRPYHSALEWMQQLKLELVTFTDVGEFWREHYPEALEEGNEEDFEGHVTSFFHLCHAAEVGLATIGRKGQPTRLRVYLDELRSYLENPDALTLAQPLAAGSTTRVNRHMAYDKTVAENSPPQHKPTITSSEKQRVFISHSLDADLLARIRETLELANLEYEIIKRGSDDTAPVPNGAFQAMQRCDAGIIVVTEDDCSKDYAERNVIKESVLMELGAAFLHFERRVVLLLDEKSPLPTSLQGLYSCNFEGQNLTWDVAMRLVKAVKHFKQQPGEPITSPFR